MNAVGTAMKRAPSWLASSDQTFLAVSALLMAVSATITILCSRSMPDMKFPLCSFRASLPDVPPALMLGMWVAMVMTMMLPALLPSLWRYRRSVAATGGTQAGYLAMIAGAGYFFVWMLPGCLFTWARVTLTAPHPEWPWSADFLPLASGSLLLFAGGLQFTTWKARYLAHCRDELSCCPGTPADSDSAWRRGVTLGLHCIPCSGALMAVSLLAGLMDLRAMAVTTIAITVERLAPAGSFAAGLIGFFLLGAGLSSIANTMGIG